jgi:hypothetical protein
MEPIRRVVFVCLHGSAKSLIAAEDFRRLAAQRGLDIGAISAGTDPDLEIPRDVIKGLRKDGIDARGRVPRKLAREDLTTAWRVVSLGCELGDIVPPGLTVERWDDVPSVSENFGLAREAILGHLHRLLDECSRSPGSSGIQHEADIRDVKSSRRHLFRSALRFLGALQLFILVGEHLGRARKANAAELAVPAGATEVRFDFEQGALDGWKSVDGRWDVEEMAESPSGKRVLVQRAVENAFNVIVAPGGPYTDVDVAVRFKPISGREDASGGIVFRFSEGRYYVVRANALEGNFRLYYYDRGRREIASARVQPPALGQWHTIRVVAVGDQIQAYLNGKLLLDHRDSRFHSGQVGLWTKADSVTAFDDLVVRGVHGTV